MLGPSAGVLLAAALGTLGADANYALAGALGQPDISGALIVKTDIDKAINQALLGVLPALHPSIGVWTGVIVALTVATDFTRLKPALRAAARIAS